MAEYIRPEDQSRATANWRSWPVWHPPEALPAPSVPNVEGSLCRYFMRGNCTYGARCRFLHSNRAGELPTAGPSVNSRPPAPNNGFTRPGVHICQPSNCNSQPPNQGNGSIGMQEQGQVDWANAPEFIPSNNLSNAAQRTYAQIVNGEATTSHMPDEGVYEIPLCPLMEKYLACKYGNSCMYVHGELCDICGRGALHPTNVQQRNKHHAECVLQTERKEELSKAMARSKDKTCGICFEVIMEKTSREQRFGILPNCNHCFCLTCIRKWRQAKQFENKIIRACPECRTTSDFVCPSLYWVQSKEEKETLIKDYKDALSVKDCKYFNSGRGKCPFGNKCFYRHAYPDGTIADVGPPVRQRRRPSEPDFGVLQQIILWDFMDERENRWLFSNIEDLEDLVAILSDGSEDSDWSDFDIVFE